MGEQQDVVDPGAVGGETFRALARAYLEADEKVAAAEDALAEAKSFLKEIDRKLVGYLSEQGQTRCHDERGQLFKILVSVYASRPAGMTSKEQLDALREAGLKDLIIETCPAASLSSYVREQWMTALGELRPLQVRTEEEWQNVLPASLRGKIRVYEERKISVLSRATPRRSKLRRENDDG